MDILVKNIKIVSRTLDSSQRKIGRNTMEKAMNVYKIATLSEMVVIKNSIVTLIKIPLVNEVHFVCKRIKPVPFVRSNIKQITSIEREYVVYNEETNSYCTENDNEVRKCLHFNKIMYCEMEEMLR